MLSIHAWNRCSHTPRTLDAAALADGTAHADPDLVVWIDLIAPTPEEEKLVFERFHPVHSLSLEDITRLAREPHAPPHLPKVEEFPNYLFVVANPLRDDYLRWIDNDDPDQSVTPFTQLSAVLTDRILITHHQEPLRCVEHLRGFLERHQSQADRGPDYLFHLILDATVDQYAPVLDHVDEALEDLEARVVAIQDDGLFRSILRVKREIILLRKTLVYEREVLVRLARGEFELVDERETIYYRNVYDHLVRFAELIESSREMASDLLQSYLASTSNRLSRIMKVLTTISTIVMPMSLVAGVYGMNFQHMPELAWPYGYAWALGLMGALGSASVAFFWWKRWL